MILAILAIVAYARRNMASSCNQRLSDSRLITPDAFAALTLVQSNCLAGARDREPPRLRRVYEGASVYFQVSNFSYKASASLLIRRSDVDPSPAQ